MIASPNAMAIMRAVIAVRVKSEDTAGVERAADVSGAALLWLRSTEQLSDELDACVDLPACLVLSASGSVTQDIAQLHDDARTLHVPTVVLVDHPSERAFLDAIRAGADDAVPSYDTGALTRRLARLASYAPLARPQGARRAVVASASSDQRRRYGRALRRTGVEVDFAADAAGLRELLLRESDVIVVVVHDTLTDDASAIHAWVRAQRGDHALPVVVLQAEEGGERGGHRVERTAWLPPNASPGNLLFVVNELLSEAGGEQRASRRMLYETLCSYRRACDMVASYGTTFNLSRGGLYVRTTDPPELGEAIWIELRPPADASVVHLRGVVAWRRVPGDAGVGTPWGFGVRISAEQCPVDDLARYREGHSVLLVPHDVSTRRESIPPEAPRLLAVDDDPTMRAVYQRVFPREGIELTLATDGEEAVQAYRAGSYDAVLTDIHMPGLNGIELLKAIRAHDDEAPVVIITGKPSTGTAIEALDHGAVRYLVKPVDATLLLEAVHRAFGLKRLARFRRQAARLMNDAHAAPIADTLGEAFQSALDGLTMHYQPIVSVARRAIVAYEALVRSSEPRLPHPGALFDAAERLDRLRDLSRRIWHVATRAFAENDHKLYLNLHPLDLLDEVLYDPSTALSRMARRVVLEITERSSLDRVDGLRERIARLRKIGFGIAVDDLGAGYAGLVAFCALEPDVAKLDMSLVRDVHSNSTKQRLIRSVKDACDDLGIVVVAEGVETLEERAELERLGCDHMQGYLFGRPAPRLTDVSWPTA
jgi:EAL domain-containing protein (putative c-di-GMP-specific phosphodiesterase class I)/CheY-like chemotaxis protein